MYTIELILQILAAVTGGMALLVSIPLFFSFRWPAALMWGIKLMVSSLSPVFILVGLFTAICGWVTNAPFITFSGIAVILIYSLHFLLVTRAAGAATGFDQAFGNNWENNIRPDQKTFFLSKRSVLRLPNVPDARLQQNICFSTIPGSNRDLLCDLWLPNEKIKPSGVAIIYLHGSAFYFLDKDFCTRPFFSHLAAQGHVIMDVAYRLAPETDIMGMVHDVKRAIVWMKHQPASFGTDENHIVLGGGSAGGHLALLSAYTWDDPSFTPVDLLDEDLSVTGVISLYGTSDLEALYYHTNQHLTTRPISGKLKKRVPTKMPGWMKKLSGKDYHRLGFDKGLENAGTLAPIMGGHPDECSERYALLSPINHVHPKCPPTLLIHGAHDIMGPVASARRLYQLLVAEKIPSVLHVLPQTDHGFDLSLPNISPAAHNAIYDVERFMTLITNRAPIIENKSSPARKRSLQGVLPPGSK